MRNEKGRSSRVSEPHLGEGAEIPVALRGAGAGAGLFKPHDAAVHSAVHGRRTCDCPWRQIASDNCLMFGSDLKLPI